MQKTGKSKLILNVSLFAAIIGVIIFVVRDSLSDIFLELADTSLPVLAGVTLLGFLSLLVEGFTVKNIVAEYNPEFTLCDGFFSSAYMSFYRVITFGTGTIVSEVLFYHKKDLKFSQGTGVVALRMVVYKVALSAVAVVFLFLKGNELSQQINHGIIYVVIGLVVTLAIVGVLLLFSLSINAQVLFVIITNRLFKRQKLRDLIDKVNMQFYSLRDTIQTFFNHKETVIKVFLSTLVKLGVWYTIPYFILSSESKDLNLLLIVALISFTVILGGILPAPGGIGGFEFVYVLLFSSVVGRVEAVSSLLLYRYATYLMPFLIGMVYVLINKQREINLELKENKMKKRVDD
ncbi:MULTISPECIES: lysylphosphatidylglycerol synthase transmembrane domain-containing protein [Enterococcus]|uniref:Phosphatidylglycerol lysyltransferase n=1 Tax=Enterococcus alishanensis TaxID=1303817 RepID=A0ABS6TBN3_9ENTE|nr:lysylphosphatidylglycerol synthase transmembrane domain-containing protein [Enterococcus alishanensis]MBV7390319.1 flippase-like domain-containing protein [Enterococcus alishanensis]